MSRRGWVLFSTMCVIWGVPYLMIRVAVRELTPATLVWSRTTIAALLLLAVPASRRGLALLLPRWRMLFLFALAEIAVPWLMISRAEQHLSSSLTGLLIAAVPLIGAAVSALSGGGDRLDARRLAGLLVGLAGVAALVGLDVGHTDTTALIEVGLTAVGYAVGPVILARSLSDLPNLPVITASLAFCALLYTPVALYDLPERVPSGRVLASVATLAILCTAIAFVLFFELIAEVGPVRATVITYVNPAVAAVLGVTLLDETFTTGMGVGFVLVLSGCLLATRRNRPGVARPAVPAPEQ